MKSTASRWITWSRPLRENAHAASRNVVRKSDVCCGPLLRLYSRSMLANAEARSRDHDMRASSASLVLGCLPVVITAMKSSSTRMTAVPPAQRPGSYACQLTRQAGTSTGRGRWQSSAAARKATEPRGG